MQKQRVVRVVAALAMGAAVAGALVWASANRGNSIPILSYNELLALAGDEAVASSAIQELEVSLAEEETASSDPEAASELETVLQEVEETLDEENTAASEAAASSETAAVSEAASGSGEEKPESAAASSAAPAQAAASEAQSAASSHHTASEAVSAPSASSTKTADELCDEKLAEYVHEIERLQKNSEKKLYQIIQAAYDEYMTHPVEERSLVLKVSVVLSKSGQLTAAQNECDAEFDRIIAEMRKTLRENGRDETLADEAVKTYKQKKNAMIKELTDQAYSGADGRGQSAKWLEERMDELN